MRPPFTDLEREVLADVVAGRDPWRERFGGSRRVSQAIGRLFRKGFVNGSGTNPTDAGRDALHAHLRPLRAATLARIDADRRAGILRRGAGEPHAWFCYLGVGISKGLACCAWCGSVMPRDSSRWDLPCVGVVRVELRASAVAS